MPNEFYDIYSQLEAAQDSKTYLPLLDRLTMLCRDDQQTESLSGPSDCLRQIAALPVLFVAAISRWLLANDDIKLAKSLIREADVQNLSATAPSTYDLSCIEEATAILSGFRLCALNAAPAISLGWALSLAIAYTKSERTKAAVNSLLQYHADEFPRTTVRLLSSETTQLNDVTQAKQTLLALKDQEDWLTTQPRLREFSMTPEMRLTLGSRRRSEDRAIQRSSHETSIFSQIFSTQYFKYANRTSVEAVIGDRVQETTLEMSPFSISIELPLSECTDPLSGADRRLAFWRGQPQ